MRTRKGLCRRSVAFGMDWLEAEWRDRAQMGCYLVRSLSIRSVQYSHPVYRYFGLQYDAKNAPLHICTRIT